jgi:hypothetical protein
MDELRVSCYSGYTCADRPRSFTWRGEEYEVAGTERAWIEPGRRCFWVNTGAGRRFDLCYLEAQDERVIAER